MFTAPMISATPTTTQQTTTNHSNNNNNNNKLTILKIFNCVKEDVGHSERVFTEYITILKDIFNEVLHSSITLNGINLKTLSEFRTLPSSVRFVISDKYPKATLTREFNSLESAIDIADLAKEYYRLQKQSSVSDDFYSFSSHLLQSFILGRNQMLTHELDSRFLTVCSELYPNFKFIIIEAIKKKPTNKLFKSEHELKNAVGVKVFNALINAQNQNIWFLYKNIYFSLVEKYFDIQNAPSPERLMNCITKNIQVQQGSSSTAVGGGGTRGKSGSNVTTLKKEFTTFKDLILDFFPINEKNLLLSKNFTLYIPTRFINTVGGGGGGHTSNNTTTHTPAEYILFTRLLTTTSNTTHPVLDYKYPISRIYNSPWVGGTITNAHSHANPNADRGTVGGPTIENIEIENFITNQENIKIRDFNQFDLANFQSISILDRV